MLRCKNLSFILKISFWITLFITTVGSIGGVIALLYMVCIFNHPIQDPQTRTVLIPKGMSVYQIGKVLEYHHVVPSALSFVVNMRLRGETRFLQAGEYKFLPYRTLYDVLRKVSKGETVVHLLTIPEGLTSQEILSLIKAEKRFSGSVDKLPPEGTLLPETYHFSLGISRQSFIDRMRQEFGKTLEKLWKNRDPSLSLRTPQEAVVLASIVEKETALPKERPHIARVFLNRLQQGMRLQSDPTVIYGLLQQTGTRPGRPMLSKKDLTTQTSHNTYVILGLPPSPICHPGFQALYAVLHPVPSEDLYFVADGSGGHAFARTVQEHQKNHRRWRKLRQRKITPFPK